MQNFIQFENYYWFFKLFFCNLCFSLAPGTKMLTLDHLPIAIIYKITWLIGLNKFIDLCNFSTEE